MKRILLLPSLLALLSGAAACSSAATPPKAIDHGPPKLVASAPACAQVDKPSVVMAEASARAEALHLLLVGRASEAAERFETILQAHPTDLGAYTLRAAAQNALAREAERGNAARARAKPTHVPGEVTSGPRRIATDKKPSLRVLESDVDAPQVSWFDLVGWRPPYQLDDAANAAAPIKEASVTRQMRFPDHGVLVFGDSLVAVAPPSGSPARLFDLHDVASQGSSILYAQVVSRVLVALVSVEQGCLLVGIDMDQQKMLWRTERGALDGYSFAVSGAYAFVGGFGDEGAVLTVEVASGQIVDRTPLPFAPAWLFAKDGELLATDNSTSPHASLGAAGGKLAPALPANVSEGAPEPTDVALRECQYARAIDAIDARDVDRALAETNLFVSPDDPPARALTGAAGFIRQAKLSPNTTIDLAGAPVVVLERPRASAFFRPAQADLGKPPTLRSTKAPPPTEKKPTAGRPGPKKPPQPPSQPMVFTGEVDPPPLHDAAPPYEQAPTMEGPAGPSFALPDTYGAASLTRSLTFPRANGEKPAAWNVGLYDHRYIAVLADTRATQVFDAQTLSEPGIGVIDVAVVGDRLLVAVGNQGPYDDVDSYVVAYSIRTGALEWRSESHVVSTSFVSMGDYVVVGDRRASAPSRIVVLRGDTGEIVGSVPTASTGSACEIQAIGWSGRDLLTTCSEGWELFEVER